jgi:hypothetical protein
LLAFSIAASFAGHAFAQNGGHYNNAELALESPQTIVVTLQLNWPQVLHQLFAPNTPFKVFLKNYSDLSETQLEREVVKLQNNLTTNAYLTLPSGAKVHFKKWQMPSNLALRESLKLSLVLIDMPIQTQSHLDPVKVTAQAQSKIPLTRAQIQLPKAFFPISVRSGDDKFWLTEQIPLAVISF